MKSYQYKNTCPLPLEVAEPTARLVQSFFIQVQNHFSRETSKLEQFAKSQSGLTVAKISPSNELRKSGIRCTSFYCIEFLDSFPEKDLRGYTVVLDDNRVCIYAKGSFNNAFQISKGSADMPMFTNGDINPCYHFICPDDSDFGIGGINKKFYTPGIDEYNNSKEKIESGYRRLFAFFDWYLTSILREYLPTTDNKGVNQAGKDEFYDLHNRLSVIGHNSGFMRSPIPFLEVDTSLPQYCAQIPLQNNMLRELSYLAGVIGHNEGVSQSCCMEIRDSSPEAIFHSLRDVLVDLYEDNGDKQARIRNRISYEMTMRTCEFLSKMVETIQRVTPNKQIQLTALRNGVGGKLHEHKFGVLNFYIGKSGGGIVYLGEKETLTKTPFKWRPGTRIDDNTITFEDNPYNGPHTIASMGTALWMPPGTIHSATQPAPNSLGAEITIALLVID